MRFCAGGVLILFSAGISVFLVVLASNHGLNPSGGGVIGTAGFVLRFFVPPFLPG